MEDSDTTTTHRRLSKNRRALLTDGGLDRSARVVSLGGRGAILTVIVIALVILTGCTDGENSPVPSDGVSSSQASTAGTATATTAPSDVPQPVYKPATDQGPAENVPIPVMPALAKEFSKEGLIAFTEYWYQTLGYAFETGNPELMMAISGPNCPNCQAIEKIVRAGHADGKWIVGGKMVLGEPNTSFTLTPESTYQVTVMARQERVKYFKADGTLSKDLGVQIAELDILVADMQADRWVALTVEQVAGSDGS